MNEMTLSAIDADPLKLDRLLGWDTVFAIRYSYVNNAIAASGRVPPSFHQQEQDEGDVIEIAGDFTSWALTTGGDGHAVMMSLRAPSVTLKRTGHSDQTRSDVEYVVKVTLQTQSAGAGPDGGQLVNFVLASGPKGSNQAITVEEVVYQGSEQDTTVRFFLRGLMEDWLNANAGTFDFVFSTVNLNSRADVDHWTWLRPTATSYAVHDDGTNMSSGIFGVMCMTEGRPVPRDHVITSDTLPDGKNGSFLISKERFLSRIYRHGVGLMIDGPVTADASRVWPDDYFELTDDDTMLTNTDDLKIDALELQEGEDPVKVTIPARTFISKLEDTYLDIQFQEMNHPYKKLIGFGYLLNVSHEIRTRNVTQLHEGCFTLYPGSKTMKPGLKVATHRASAVKTEAAKTLDVILIITGILSIVLPLLRWGWAKYAAQGVEEIEGGAAGAAAMVQEEVATTEQVVLADAAGAEAAMAIAEGTEQGWGAWFAAQITTKRAAIMGTMSAAGFTAEMLLPYLANKDAERELPHYDEFAAEIMKPIAWPYASGFEVTEIDFNSCFQTMGEPRFDETLV